MSRPSEGECRKFTAADLDEEFHQMTREELLDEIAIRIESYQEMLVLNWKERQVIQSENKDLRNTLENGTHVIEAAIKERERYQSLFKDISHKSLMWKYSCYGMVFIFISLLIMLKIN